MSSIASDVVSPITDYFSYESNKSALNSENSALSHLQFADPNSLNSLAQQFDTTRYNQGFTAQDASDPLFSQLRTSGASTILNGLEESQNPNSVANNSISQLQSQANEDNTQMAPLIGQLEGQAQKDLSEGATMDPSFENELVTAGLAGSGSSGFNLDGSAITGSNIRTLLGTQGIALQQARAAEAQNLLGTASNLQTQRANILSNLITQGQNLLTSQAAMGLNAATLGNSTVPSIGLTGADASNLSLGNTNLKNQIILGKGKINAQKDLNTGNFINSEINSGAKLVSDVAGAYFGGGIGGMGGSSAGAAAGGTGGGFNFLNGLMGNNQLSYMPTSSTAGIFMNGNGASSTIAAAPNSPNNWANIQNY